MREETVVYTLDDFADILKEPVPQRPRHEYLKKVVEYTKEGVYVASYNSVAEAHRVTGLLSDTIRNVCYGSVLCTNVDHGSRIFLYRGADIADRLRLIKEKKVEYKMAHPHVVTAKEVCEYTLGGRFLFKYPAVKEAALANNITSYMIHNCSKGKRLFVDKRIFLYPGDDIKQRVKEVKAELYRLSQKKPKYREVDEYSLDGKFIKAYPSASAASRELDIHVSDITRCCNGYDGYSHNKFTAKGKIFLWVGDSISDRLEQMKKIKRI
jgi:hypothetical protein